MGERKSQSENTCSARLSQEEIQVPLSPVLGSGQSVKKLLKYRKERHKRELKKVAQKLENVVKPQKETDKNYTSVQLENGELMLNDNDDSMLKDFEKLEESISNIEPIPGPSKPKLLLEYNRQDMPDNLLDRIQILEELENKKSNIIKALSLSKTADLKTLENVPSNSNYQPGKINENNAKDFFQKPVNEKRPDTFSKDINKLVHFQTCAGKGISIAEADLNKYAKLFDDILCPTDKQSVKKKKFNYLSKNENQEKNATSEILCDKTESTIKYVTVSPYKNSKTDLNLIITTNMTRETYIETEEKSETGKKSSFKTFLNIENDHLNKVSKKQLQNGPQQKLLKNIFEEENFDDLEKISYNSGFQPASTHIKDGKYLNRTKESIVNVPFSGAKQPPRNIFEGENFGDLNFIENVGFKSVSLSLKDPRSDLTKADAQHMDVSSKKSWQDLDDLNKKTNSAQACKRGILPNKDEPPSKKPFKNIFEGENFDDLNVKSCQGFKSSLSNLKTTSFSFTNPDNKPKAFRNIFEDENFDDLYPSGLKPKFETPLSKKYLQNQTFESPYQTPIIKNIVQQDADNQSDDNFYGFGKEEQKIALNIAESNCDIINIVENRFKRIKSQQNDEPLINLGNIDSLSKNVYSNVLKFMVEGSSTNHSKHLGKKRKFSELDSDHNSLCKNKNVLPNHNMKASSSNTPLDNSFLKRPKKRLGCHFSPTIQISETVLKKAKLLFEDLKHTPVETSTPIKFDRSLATPLECDLTPVQGVRKNLGDSFLDAAKRSFSRSINKTLDQTLVKNNARFGLNRPSEGDVKDWIENLNCERRLLEEMLRVVDDKQTILANQRTMLEFSAKGKNRIIPGVLYNSKCRMGRICLKDLSSSSHSEDTFTNFLNQINPQNAHLVHFYVENKRQSHIKTLDGAVVVPNAEGRIGISEIEHSFKVLEGVDPKLLPKGWIQNHYKWIIWKLASYERMFADKCEGCLCVENIVQQLKYRYDIEIDKVKRSALHKIFEKDDCPQRRLVLCISRIIKVTHTYELELTDGWYPIRTVIDPLLCDQILKGKIKLGVKLMTYGAELMNCEGCHPLEATEQIFLKINYNSTRRTTWWTKLGCQKDSGPFLIPLASVNIDGGKIGCIKCFILRVYPVKYMEKCGNLNVWRNRKAEERREQEFYNEKLKALERTNNSLSNECNKNYLYLKESNGGLLKSIRNIDDPEILYEILQKSTDPESIQENLSFSQKTILYNYTINKSAQNQSKGMNNFNEKAQILQERSVTSLLKIKIVNASCESNVIYDFYVWRPQESHIQELREGEIVTIFNVSCSNKWGLNANRTTQFKKEQKPKDDQYQNFRRHVISIEKLQYFSKENEILPEFDTVGIVVRKKVGDHQQVWLSDYKGNLLVIKIHDSPKNVLVLDAVNEGQIVTVCNLIFKHSSEEYSLALADHFVIFSRYSQYKHLQEAAESLEKEVDNMDLNALLQYCNNKVNNIETKWDCRSPKLAGDVDDMDCSQITTTDLALLECVDKLT